MTKNDSPFEPWNGIDADSPFAPWNNLLKESPFACWNSPFGRGRYREECDNYGK